MSENKFLVYREEGIKNLKSAQYIDSLNSFTKALAIRIESDLFSFRRSFFCFLKLILEVLFVNFLILLIF
jgi:hypothetical protein